MISIYQITFLICVKCWNWYFFGSFLKGFGLGSLSNDPFFNTVCSPNKRATEGRGLEN